MKLTRRGNSGADTDEVTADGSDTDATGEAQPRAAQKGRPTPKRRDAEGRRGPVSAPRTRKEAYARQRELSKQDKQDRARTSLTKGPSGGSGRTASAAERRAALRRGDPDALPRRDQGRTRKLARDYVDSKRMLSNYMLWLFPLFIVASIVPVLRYLEPVVIVILLALVVEWYIVGRRLRAMAMQRFSEADGSNLSIGFYMGQRAYLPRKWRIPGPAVERGETF